MHRENAFLPLSRGSCVTICSCLLAGSILVSLGCNMNSGASRNNMHSGDTKAKLDKLSGKFLGLSLNDAAAGRHLAPKPSSDIVMVLLKDGQMVHSISLQSIVVVKDNCAFLADLRNSSLDQLRLIQSSGIIDQLCQRSSVDVSRSYWIAAYCNRAFDIREIKLLGPEVLPPRRSEKIQGRDEGTRK